MEYYGIDFGGTNLRISRVDPETGRLTGDMASHPMKGISANEELTRLIFDYIPDGSHVGISAAGPVDEQNLIIKFATNSPIKSEITFGRDLRDRKGCTVTQTNDMNAAVQAAARYGQGKGHRHVLLATFSSGYNCSLTRGGVNVTTAEIGHSIYKPGGDLYCGCGGKGHLETYVSGNGAATMARQYLGIRQLKDHPILDFCLADCNSETADSDITYTKSDLSDPRLYGFILERVTAKHVYASYRQAPSGQPQKDIRNVQIEAIADSFGRMNSFYHPVDIFVLMGSQTRDWDLLFEPAIEKYKIDDCLYQLGVMPKPIIKRTQFSQIGIVGAVAFLLSKQERAGARCRM